MILNRFQDLANSIRRKGNLESGEVGLTYEACASTIERVIAELRQPASVKIVFEYDEKAHKWQAKAEGVSSQKEAKQAFAAVVLTCQMLESALLSLTKVDDNYNITPAV